MYSLMGTAIGFALGAILTLMVGTTSFISHIAELKEVQEELTHKTKIYERYTKRCRKLLREREARNDR